MTEQEAFEAFCAKWHAQKNEYGESLTDDERDCAEEAWNAALAWLRSQAEPVAVVGNHQSLVRIGEPGLVFIEPGTPLYATPQPVIPDGWQAIETYDGMKKKPAHAVFWFEGTAPARGQLGKYGLPPMMSLERIRGSRICTHWMPLPLAPEPRK